jgi:signal transduction histidine kinase
MARASGLPRPLDEFHPLTSLLEATNLLLSAADEPRAWGLALQALASGDPFFAETTMSLCQVDLERGGREVLASYGPRAYQLAREELTLTDVRGSARRLVSRFQDGKFLFVLNCQRLPEAVADFLGRLLPARPAGSLALLPLLSSGRIIGLFWVEGYDPAECTRDRRGMLQLLGNCLAMTLAASMRRREAEEKEAVLRMVMQAQEEDRQRIALDVHDGALQMLASVFQHLQAAKGARRQADEARAALMKASGLLRESMQELRSLMERLRPAALDRLGLISAIESDVQELRQAGWELELVADPTTLSREREAALYRIVHEALTNVKKHAGHCRVRVSLQRKRPYLWVEVRDWGRGFDPAALLQKGTQGFGLLSMRKRAEMLGGRLELESSPGAGTRVSLQIPMRRKIDQPPWSL